MPKLVRKTRSNWQGLVLDYLLEISEDLSLFNWDKLSSQWIAPLGFVINVVYWMACAQIGNLSTGLPDSVFENRSSSRDRGSGYNSSQWWRHTLQSLTVGFVVLSVLNVWFCFTRTREYQLQQNKDATDSWSGADAKATKVTSSSGSKSVSMIGAMFRRILNQNNNETRIARDYKHVLAAWNPSILSLRLFCIFSPVHAIIIFSYAKNVLILIPIALLSVQNLYLVQLFEQHIQDKQSIYGQVFTEYETKFVQPRVGVMKRDVGVGTRPDDNGVYVEVHTPKVGIVDASKTISDLPRSASRIRMHDWERPVTGVSREIPTSPNVWAQGGVSQSTRHTVASPIKINGSPAKMFRPAGWGTSSTSSSFHGSNPFVQNQNDNTNLGGIKRSKTTSSLSNKWD